MSEPTGLAIVTACMAAFGANLIAYTVLHLLVRWMPTWLEHRRYSIPKIQDVPEPPWFIIPAFALGVQLVALGFLLR